jgi:hypothetical protein
MLLFKKKFIELIRNGTKTQTIRFWSHCRMKPGQRSYIPGIGYISIISVEPVAVEQLTDADAVPDGFKTATLLQQELRSLYAEEMKKGFRAFRICFSVFPQDVQQRMKEERRQKKEKKLRQREKESKEFVDAALAKLHRLASTGTRRKVNSE